MAILKDQNGSTELKFYPYRISDNEAPVWVLVQIEFMSRDKIKISDTLSVIREDIDSLINGINNFLENNSRRFHLITFDDNFVLNVYREENENLIGVEFYFGEKYVLWEGYRFITIEGNLKKFLSDLIVDKSNIKPLAELP